jgi:osmotically-inducible protein OsmY
MRTILRALLVSILIVIVALFAFGYWTGSARWRTPRGERPAQTVGTTGQINTEKARERGAELGEKAAAAANKVAETVGEAAITTKIKAKMALDDSVKARAIDVSTQETVVTLSGTVQTPAERARAVALARETSGVTKVVDRIVVQPADGR